MNTIAESLYLSILKHRDNIAFNIDGESFLYLQLMKRIACLQSEFTTNYKIAESIGIIANQDFDTYAAIIAALLSGITYIPIEPTHPDERNNHIVKISKAEAIFCSDFSSMSTEFHAANKNRFIDITSTPERIDELRVLHTSNPAYVLFTSGSTGIPKGVPISLQNLRAFAENVAVMNLDISEQSRFLQVFDLTFDLSVFSYLIPLLHGASVFTLPKSTFKQMAAVQLIQDHEITHVLTVPSFVNYMKPLFAKIKLPSVTNWLFCGEALQTKLLTDWQKCIPHANIFNVYGPTEATIFCSSYKCTMDATKSYQGIVSIGKPFKHTGFSLFDRNMPVSSCEIAAELCIAGLQLTSGYLGDPDKNKKAFFTHKDQLYYRSGDLSRRDIDEDYFYTGRNDSQVKINGFRVEISELEYHAAKYPGIDESVVIVTENDKYDHQILNLVYTSRSEKDKADLLAFLSTKVPFYMLPSEIFLLESIPHNLNGKIDKRALTELINQMNKK